MNNTENAFGRYVNGLPDLRREAIEQICAASHTGLAMVRLWLSGRYEVPVYKRAAIAAALGRKEEELWPED